MRATNSIILKIIDRIVAAAAPKKIILFGSAARGKTGPNSDLDFLVVTSCPHRRQMARTIRRRLIGIALPIDIIVATPEDIRLHKDAIGLIYRPALREGRTVYAA